MRYTLVHEGKEWKWNLRYGFDIPDGSIVRIIDATTFGKPKDKWDNSKVSSTMNQRFDSVIWFNQLPSSFHDPYLEDLWKVFQRDTRDFRTSKRYGFIILPNNTGKICCVGLDKIFPVEFSNDVDLIKIHSRQKRLLVGDASIRIDDILFLDNTPLYNIVNNIDLIPTAHKIPIALLKRRNGVPLTGLLKKDRVENDTTEAENKEQEEWEELERNA